MSASGNWVMMPGISVGIVSVGEGPRLVSSGLSPDLIKLQGDWNSNACERYLKHSFRLRQEVALKLGRAAEDLAQCKTT